MSANLSKNDAAWQAIFQEEDIISSIQRDGYFYISSEKINKHREARLMTKFDHQVQLPKIFKDNQLSIQPVSRGGYIIGGFSSYFSLPEYKRLPEGACHLYNKQLCLIVGSGEPIKPLR